MSHKDLKITDENLTKPERFNTAGKRVENGDFVLWTTYEKAIRYSYTKGVLDNHKAVVADLNRKS